MLKHCKLLSLKLVMPTAVLGFLAVACADKVDEHSFSLSELGPDAIAGLSSRIECADSNECPSDVALIARVGLDEQGEIQLAESGQCTGRLVKENIIMTNGHCVPDLSAGDSCENSFWFIFPANGEKESLAVECDKVIEAIDANPGSRIPKIAKEDFAFLQLKKSPGRKHLKLSLEGVADKDELVFYKVDPVASREIIRGELVKESCTVSVEEQLSNGTTALTTNVKINDIVAPVVDNCESIGGNSGSAIEVSGTLRGVLFGGGYDSMRFTNFGATFLVDRIRAIAEKNGF